MTRLFTTLLLAGDSDAIAGIFVLLIVGLIYFLPAIIGRKKRDATAIFWLNLLAGWTGIGWLGVLIWALKQDPLAMVVQQPAPMHTSVPRAPVAPVPQAIVHSRASANPTPVKPAVSMTDELERLFQLKEKGALTEEEYIVHKAKLLA